MIVKEVLLEALSRANDIRRGSAAPAEDITNALAQFNAQLRKYSDNNLVTAFQRVLTFEGAEELVIGKPSYKKNIRITNFETMPTDDQEKNCEYYYNQFKTGRYTFGKDYFFEKSTGKYYVPAVEKFPPVLGGTLSIYNLGKTSLPVEGGQFKDEGGRYEDSWNVVGAHDNLDPGEMVEVGATGTPNSPDVGTYLVSTIYPLLKGEVLKKGDYTTEYLWAEVDPSEILTFRPDVLCEDISRITSAMYRSSDGHWNKLNFIPLDQFYTEDDDEIYCSNARGENKVNFYLPPEYIGKEIRVVYNTSMKFGKDDVIELPEVHIELMTLATAKALLISDADADPRLLDGISMELQQVEEQIKMGMASNRRIRRQSEYDRFHPRAIITGEFLRRK